MDVPLTLLLIIALLGFLGATLSSVAGFGGGMLLTVGLFALLSPHEALAIAAPALLLGHLHRLTLLHRHVDWATAGWLLLGALPAGALAALVAARIPTAVLGIAVVCACVAGLVAGRGRSGPKERRPVATEGQTPAQGPAKCRLWLPGRGALVGVLLATTGIGGPVMPATLMGVGLSGVGFVATATACAIGIHAVRIAGYWFAGMMDLSTWPLFVLIAVASVGGNLCGRWLAPMLGEARARVLTTLLLAISCLAALTKLFF